MSFRSFVCLIFAYPLFILGHSSLALADVSNQTLLAANEALDAYESDAIEVSPISVAAATETTPAAPVVSESQAVAVETAPAEEESPTLLGGLLKEYNIEPTGSATLDYYTRYAWRGQYLDRDAVLQPGVSLSANGFTVGYWSSVDMENRFDERYGDFLASDENDYYVSYAYTYDAYTLTVGHTWYDFPEYDSSSKEFFASIGMAGFLSPVLSIFHDYEDGQDYKLKSMGEEGRGNYYSLSLAHSIPLENMYGMSVDLGTTFGYVDSQWINGKGWHFTPTASLGIPITKSFKVSPTIGYNVPMGDLKDPNDGNQERHVFGGVKSIATF